MLIRMRRRNAGQAIVIMALAMVAICGMLALAIDAGRLYFQRRLMQDAVDAGALAGAQSLVASNGYPNGQPNQALYFAAFDALATLKQTPPDNNPNAAPYTPQPANNTVVEAAGGYTVTVVAPGGYNNKQVQVTVSYTAVATFVQVLGFNQINIVATATAEAGTNAKTYALFAYTSGGSGNTINDDQSGFAQVDDGQDGADACNPSVNGYAVSNAKFHVPNPNTPKLNVNGVVTVDQASDNHSLYQYWQSPVGFGTAFDPEPNYLIPDTSGTANALNPTKHPISPGTSTVINGQPITNNSSSKWVYVFTPGKYTGTITIPGPGDNAPSSIYIFLNGLYYFTSGANLTITGGYVSNTSTGMPHYAGSPAVGATDLLAASDGTNGVEFVFDQGSAFSASNSSLANDGSVFFVAPSFVPTGSTHVAFYIASTNANTGAVWSETLNASASNVPRFQIWGTVFDASLSGSMTLTGVQLGPHNTAPIDTNSSGQYAITGEFIGATLQINNGNVLGNTAGTPATCNNVPIGQGTPALLVQYNSKFAPAPGVNSFLVK
jgi:Flp pilus assembly protein TadG